MFNVVLIYKIGSKLLCLVTDIPKIMNELVICVLMMNQYPTLFLWYKEETLLSKSKIYKKGKGYNRKIGL